MLIIIQAPRPVDGTASKHRGPHRGSSTSGITTTMSSCRTPLDRQQASIRDAPRRSAPRHSWTSGRERRATEKTGSACTEHYQQMEIPAHDAIVASLMARPALEKVPRRQARRRPKDGALSHTLRALCLSGTSQAVRYTEYCLCLQPIAKAATARHGRRRGPSSGPERVLVADGRTGRRSVSIDTPFPHGDIRAGVLPDMHIPGRDRRAELRLYVLRACSGGRSGRGRKLGTAAAQMLVCLDIRRKPQQGRGQVNAGPFQQAM